ncbi:MAG: hypothetical protein AAFP68_02765 [Pseudomonadota bacterium]
MPIISITPPVTSSIIADVSDSLYLINASVDVSFDETALIVPDGTANQIIRNFGSLSTADTAVDIGTGIDGTATTFVNETGGIIRSETIPFNSARADLTLINYGSIGSTFSAGLSHAGSNSTIYNFGSISGFLDGAFISGDHNLIINTGAIFGGSIGLGLAFSGSGSRLDNYGNITASFDEVAVLVSADRSMANMEINNSGTIDSDRGIQIRTDPGGEIDGFDIRNDGTVFGSVTGIDISGDVDGVRIVNSGDVSGYSGAIRIDVIDPNALIIIENQSSGVVENFDFSTDPEGAIIADTGRQFVLNSGTIDGDVTLGAQDDRYVGEGAGEVNGAVFGGDGDDRLFGSDENDRLFGDAGRDFVFGGGGNDTIFGGADQDQLFGDEGSDRFVFTTETDSQDDDAENDNQYDVIRDFEVGVDQIDLSGIGLFAGFDDDGGQTEAGELRLAYSAASDRTYLRSDQSVFEVALSGDFRATLTEDDFIFV